MIKLHHNWLLLPLLLQLLWINLIKTILKVSHVSAHYPLSNAHGMKAVNRFVKQAFPNEMLFVDHDLLKVKNTHETILRELGTKKNI